MLVGSLPVALPRESSMRLPLILSLVLCVASLSAGEWPSWRGPHGSGIADGELFPTQWTATENVKWKVPLPGAAGSTPVVTGPLIALTCAERDADNQNGMNKVWGLSREGAVRPFLSLRAPAIPRGGRRSDRF